VSERVPHLAVRLAILAALGSVIGLAVGELLVLARPDAPSSVLWRILSAASGGVATLFLAEDFTGWTWTRRGVAVGILAPAIGALLFLGALSPAGIVLAPFAAVVLWPMFVVTIPAGLAISFLYSRFIMRTTNARSAS
jgi:hypothetical protein